MRAEGPGAVRACARRSARAASSAAREGKRRVVSVVMHASLGVVVAATTGYGGGKLVHARPRYRPECTAAAQPIEQRLGGSVEGAVRAVGINEQIRVDRDHVPRPR